MHVQCIEPVIAQVEKYKVFSEFIKKKINHYYANRIGTKLLQITYWT